MNQKIQHELSFQDLEYYGKNNRVQIPDDLIFLKVVDKNRKLLLEINDYDNFEHISDLVIEELEELQLKGKIFNQEQALKKEVAQKVSSIYQNYQWIFFPSEEYYFLFFIGIENRLSLCERQFQRLVNFFEDLNLNIQSTNDSLSKIKNYLQTIINKNKAIKKLEQEEFSPCCYKLSIEELEGINTPLDTFPEITLMNKKQSQNRLIWTSVTLISLSAMLLIIWYFKPQVSKEQNNLEQSNENLTNIM